MNRRGNLFDPLMIIIIIFALGISTSIYYIVVSDINDDFQERFDEQVSKDAIAETKEAIKAFDYVFVITLSMLVISVVVSAFFIRSHPVFAIVSTILLVIFLIPAAALSNAWEKFSEQEKVATSMADLSLIDYYVGKLPWILFVCFMMVLVLLYAFKHNPEGGGNYYG